MTVNVELQKKLGTAGHISLRRRKTVLALTKIKYMYVSSDPDKRNPNQLSLTRSNVLK